MTRSINRVSVVVQNQLVLARIERAEINAVALIPCVSTRNSGAIEEVAAVGQEVREVVHLLLARLIQRQGDRRAARLRNAVQRAKDVGSEDDHAVAVPRRAAPTRCIAKRLRGTARGVNFLELAVREKSYEAAVGRPERIRRPLSPGQRLSRKRRERAEP